MYLAIKKAISPRIKNFRFYLSTHNHPLFIGFYRYLYKPKKNSLSEFLNAYSLSLKGQLSVIQIGANDGITHDPIHKFIKRDQWKGVLLEPQQYVYTNYLQKIYQKNPNIHTIHAALGGQDGTQQLYKIGFSDMRWATGLASFNRSNVEKAFKSGLVAARCKKHGIEIPNDTSKHIVSETVKVISPETLQQKYQLANIDLLQIDTEGFDYQIIKMFDIAKYKPKAIIFENVHLSREDSINCIQLLNNNDYVCRKYGSNTLAMKRPLKAFEHFFHGKIIQMS